MNDTICALATPQGGAISVVRISGVKAIEYTSKIFTPRKGLPLAERKSHTAVFGDVCVTPGELLDEVLVTVMRAPYTYTGEDVVEISCHASPYITLQILLALFNLGARQAEPGEFTMRAFLNGKMDLSRAEAVADLIASSSKASHRLAMNQLKGDFSNELGNLRNKLLKLTTLMELELDFSEEDVTFADRSELMQLCDEIDGVMTHLTDSFAVGNAVKNGVPVAIVGETNAGKSTLLNALLREERAIVSDISGTTRDTIEGTMTIGGTTFRFIDTAGLRETSDVVEQMGIQRTVEQLRKTSIALWIVDPAADYTQMEITAKKILPECKEKKLAILVNKSDTIREERLAEVMKWGKSLVAECGEDIVWNENDMWAISARLRSNLDRLEEFLVRSAALPAISRGDVVVTNVRHYEALTRALNEIKEVKHGLELCLSGDLVSEHLRAAIHNLSEIVGEVTNDEVLGNIFANFCIGK
ncbi:MAG: tRNA uridine-5-carboxymethylaminomethyl(34) synthesis GTPase MnmE [Bacteroidaceae bacterium]|nr:tRNA uridine-5-carboxymethylaminomethyl(34) synthesis GTPase MnmE [Bacteroidaceae bacterium]